MGPNTLRYKLSMSKEGLVSRKKDFKYKQTGSPWKRQDLFLADDSPF